MSEDRFVAIKVLNESKGNGEDFMNAIASISRTSRVNIMTLLGFCFEKSKRDFIYDFMPRGSLDKFIYSQGSNNQSRQLDKESIISMACARGTIRYIAPKVFCRNFGGVSYKLDVYSYEMVVLEMVGGRKNIDVGVSQTSEVYFPSWIYEHLDQSMNLNLKGVIVEEEEEITRKLIMVSLDPSD
ncbi:hypothetical protein Golob_024222 [Gossypium lobatum]|uniref:Serine-threonine/tyrosine-protein kinase catalytic domain-containing protein n=2 Tax=Gossypium lobatum TaxID=34289 RepID=A0A7J8NHY9_9ROSI|nr:hypothetical protein [Gossypium lobatum]